MESYNSEIEKTKELLEEQFAIVSSLVNIYHTVHLINLEDNTYITYVSSQHMQDYLLPNKGAIETMRNVIHNVIRDDYLDEAFTFTELTTLPLRMKNKGSISIELVGCFTGWIRAKFITVNRNIEGYPTRVLFTTEVIDKEKKKLEGLIYQSNCDELTGLFNRRGYENDLTYYPEVPAEKDFVYVSMDVNGLKTVNDVYGHTAGDELILGAAECVKKCFGPYGKLYRVGGDEFVGMIYASPNKLSDLKRDFEQTLMNWKGSSVSTVSVSCGFATKEEFPEMTIRDMSKIADRRMYAQKAIHYSAKGIDRRMQQLAYNALCNSYMMILKVDLDKDAFTAIKIDKEELTPESGYSDVFTQWFRNHVRKGLIFEDDVKLFLKKTNINNLKRYFAKGKTSRTFYYRRKSSDDEFKFVMMEIVTTQDFNPQNQTVFLYIKNIEN